MSRYKLEVLLSEELLARLDAARLHEPRASFARRALEAAVAPRPLPQELLDSSRREMDEMKATYEPPSDDPPEKAEEPYVLPKIAKRKW